MLIKMRLPSAGRTHKPKPTHRTKEMQEGEREIDVKGLCGHMTVAYLGCAGSGGGRAISLAQLVMQFAHLASSPGPFCWLALFSGFGIANILRCFCPCCQFMRTYARRDTNSIHIHMHIDIHPQTHVSCRPP